MHNSGVGGGRGRGPRNGSGPGGGGTVPQPYREPPPAKKRSPGDYRVTVSLVCPGCTTLGWVRRPLGTVEVGRLLGVTPLWERSWVWGDSTPGDARRRL